MGTARRRLKGYAWLQRLRYTQLRDMERSAAPSRHGRVLHRRN